MSTRHASRHLTVPDPTVADALETAFATSRPAPVPLPLGLLVVLAVLLAYTTVLFACLSWGWVA